MDDGTNTASRWRNVFSEGMSHKGNKSYLSSKECKACRREFSWRKKWEKNWDEVKYCSDTCRKGKSN